MRITRALLLIGSAKPAGTSTSEALGRYLLGRLEAHDVATTMLPVTRSAAHREAASLAAAAADADLFILATPLYVDSLPYLVTRALEGLAAARRTGRPRRRAFVALVNCGFPESEQCRTALNITRVFARHAGFQWAGGLALGEGGAIDGRPLEDLGGMARHIRSALDLAASALLEGMPVPADAVAQLARPLVPPFVYTMIGNYQWKRQARRNGVRSQLGARPFDE